MMDKPKQTQLVEETDTWM